MKVGDKLTGFELERKYDITYYPDSTLRIAHGAVWIGSCLVNFKFDYLKEEIIEVVRVGAERVVSPNRSVKRVSDASVKKKSVKKKSVKKKAE